MLASRRTNRQTLVHAGKVSHDTARLEAEAELDRFRAAQDVIPQPVDQHFAAAIEELKEIEGLAKKVKSGRKKKGGSP